MNRDRIIQTGAAGVMALAMAGSALLAISLSNSAGRNRLSYTKKLLARFLECPWAKKGF